MKEKSKKKNKWIWWVGGIFLFFIIIGIIGNSGEDYSSDKINANVINTETKSITLEEAKQKSIDVSYEDLMRYSESYIGKWVCFKGQVLQVVSDIPQLELRVSTKKEDLGEYWDSEPLYYDDVVYLYSKGYQGERLLEEDIIEFCGESTGTITYEAILGNQISIPEIETSTGLVKRIS